MIFTKEAILFSSIFIIIGAGVLYWFLTTEGCPPVTKNTLGILCHDYRLFLGVLSFCISVVPFFMEKEV